MNFKKRVNGSWVNTPNYIHKTDTDTFTTLPAVLYPNDTTATAGLKGQMEQSGTPTPSSPITPSECGERTGNLFDPNSTRYQMGKATNNQIISDYSGGAMFYIEAAPNTSYTIKAYTADSTFVRLYLSNAPIIEGTRIGYNVISESETTLNPEVTISNTDYAYLWIQVGGTWYTEHGGSSIMLNTGSTALPYEPYGQYKIPILSANTTTPVYLGEVESTRRIKKLVLDGTESSWIVAGVGDAQCFRLDITGYLYDTINICYCTHYESQQNITKVAEVIDKHCAFYANPNNIYYSFNIKDITYTTVEDFKSYLAQQYAAGTPVTVWYVLATPTTAVVNEPIRKIGTYADEVSGITIPTIAGANTLSVDTTLQPSEVSVNYKGWHPVQSVHEAENGAWT